MDGSLYSWLPSQLPQLTDILEAAYKIRKSRKVCIEPIYGFQRLLGRSIWSSIHLFERSIGKCRQNRLSRTPLHLVCVQRRFRQIIGRRNNPVQRKRSWKEYHGTETRDFCFLMRKIPPNTEELDEVWNGRFCNHEEKWEMNTCCED